MTHHYQLTASEFPWEISEGKTIQAMGFNGSVPGPMLKAAKGDTMRVTVKNELKEPTVVHWHGIRLPASMDGTDHVQRLIQPGEEFVYEFVVPDAGTFWYHSHHNETRQMERGMYGALVVEENAGPTVDAERVLMIDDMKLEANQEFTNGNFLSRWIERHDGRQGETHLVNGRENDVIEMDAGQVERWRLVNASSARYFRLFLSGRNFQLIATDGGLIERPVELTELLLVPGERADILVGPFNEGETLLMEALPYNRVTMVKTGRDTYATIRVGAEKTSVYHMPEKMRTILPLAGRDAVINRKVRFGVDLSLQHVIDFTVNGRTHDEDEPVAPGELQVWEVWNSSRMDHPFHLHGFFFQVLEVNGNEPDYLSWKDTINLPPQSRAKIAWRPDNRVGRWMYHCHILEHHEAGMMGHFEVKEPGTEAKAHGSHQHH